MTTPVDHDAIEQLARAMFGQLSPLTGTRGTGTVTVNNPTLAAIELPPNMYLLPVLSHGTGTNIAELADDLVFKIAPNPATAGPHETGGAWTIPAGGSLPVAIRSNLGGARHNMPAGTVFKWDPPLDGLALSAVLDADITDAADAAETALALRRVVYYEELDAAALERDIHGGRLSQLPGLMLVWQQSLPAEGRTAGTNQGSTRLADGVRAFSENYRLFIVAANRSSDSKRRASGLRLMQAVTRLLTDQQRTTDGEQLTSLGSLEILNRSRFVRGDRFYVYALALRLNRLVVRVDNRSFVPWLRTDLEMALPGREAPEPSTPATVVDIGVPIPPGPLGP